MPKICVRIIVKGSSDEVNIVSKSVSPDNDLGLPSGVTLDLVPRDNIVEYNICMNATEGRDLLSLKNTVIDLIEHLKIADCVYHTVVPQSVNTDNT
ncbi:MAG: hypothetical protein F7B60_05025 [Desulfurococcales archaeon]|nr:hypothetical protein [Desulfurococcales archaeon]